MRVPLAKRLYDESDGLPPERAINCYARALTPDGSKGAGYKITHVPGLSELTTVSGACRGLWYDLNSTTGTNLLAVFGDNLFTIDSSWAATDTTYDVTTSTLPVKFAASESEIAILSGSVIWRWNGSALSEVTDADLPGVNDIAYLGGRFLAIDTNSNDVYYSDSDDLTSWTALGFVTAGYEADRAIGLCVDNDELLIFGAWSTEVWRTTSSSSAPYARRIGGVIPKGCPARYAIIRADNSIFFPGHDRGIYRLSGHVPVRISPPWLDQKLIDLSRVNYASIEAGTFCYDGQTFVQFDLPGDGTYWYNAATGEWNERVTTGATLALPRIYPWNMQRGGTGDAHGDIVAGGRTGNLYLVDRGTFLDDATAITRTFTAFMPVDRGGVAIDSVALTGTSGRTASGSPTMTQRWSDDGGQSFSSTVSRSIGAAGDYDLSVLWQGLGMTRPPGRLMEFATASACAFDVAAVRVNEPLPF